MQHRETAVEIGLALLAAGLRAAAGVLVFGRASGGARRGRRRNEATPSGGSVAPERHHHTSTVSAR